MLELSTYTPASLVAPLEPPLTFRRHSGRGKARDEATGRGRHGGRETTFFVQLPYFLSIFVCAGRVSLCPKRAQEASGRAVTATVTPGLGRPSDPFFSTYCGPTAEKKTTRNPLTLNRSQSESGLTLSVFPLFASPPAPVVPTRSVTNQWRGTASRSHCLYCAPPGPRSRL